MKKIVKIGSIILILIALIFPITCSYGNDKIAETEEEISFLEISELEVAEGKKIEMTINLDEIEYTQFIFKLESSENIENVEVNEDSSSTSDEEQIEVETNNNEMTIEINKETTNISTIILYYQIPDTVEVGDTIKFIATITNIEDEEDEETIETEITIIEQETEKDTTSNENEDTTNNNSKNEENIEKSEESAQEMSENQQSNTEKQSEQNDSTNSSKQNVETTTSITTTTTTTTVKSSQSTEETVTYNGSDNNYLSELSVEGYTLNKEFSKDNSTYFVTVENDVDTLNITKTVDDDSATVYIYGNEDLIEGTNKILISVTAENGNVRNYRIYVIKNS